MLVTSIFSSPEHKVPRVSYCDHSPSVVVHRLSSVCPSACSSVVCLHFLVYILAPTNINQSAPNLVKIYMTITSRMSSIMDVIGPEPLELFAHELKKNCYISLCLQSSIYKYQPVSTKLGQNIYDHKISNEFDFGSNRTKTTRVICS